MFGVTLTLLEEEEDSRYTNRLANEEENGISIGKKKDKKSRYFVPMKKFINMVSRLLVGPIIGLLGNYPFW